MLGGFGSGTPKKFERSARDWRERAWDVQGWKVRMNEPKSSVSRRDDPPVPPAPVRPPFFDRRRLKMLPRMRQGQGLLAGMRIRKKLAVLHTLFTLLLAAVLLVAVRPAVLEVVMRAEVDKAVTLLDLAVSSERPRLVRGESSPPADGLPPSVAEFATMKAGSATSLGLDGREVAALTASPGKAMAVNSSTMGPCAAVFVPPAVATTGNTDEPYRVMTATIGEARQAVSRLYLLVVAAIIAIYILVALALEVFVLPQNVYRPIRRLLDADQAAQLGRKDEELIPGHAIPDDELGEIMRSRNSTVQNLRRQEAELAVALTQLETVATDLKRKNHLIETAQRNLADADRLVSLGMMSAGIAHELNTPLAVLKGLVEKLNSDPKAGMDAAQAALMLRVVGRIERLGDSLLDFARVRPPQTKTADVRRLVQEALDLVRLDRDASGVELKNLVADGTMVVCDGDRIVQVLVNLTRNAVNSISGSRRKHAATIPGGNGAISLNKPDARPDARPEVRVQSSQTFRDGQHWFTLTVIDDGPGIDATILPRLFEPFASTRLDSRGTGLGLAVSEGIVREHGGVLLARNRTDRSGAVFEVVLPITIHVALTAEGAGTIRGGVGENQS